MNSSNELNSSLKVIAKSSLIVFISFFLSKIFTYLYRIITARTFGQEMYGVYSLTLVVSGFFLAFSSLGLQSGLLRFISFYRGGDKKEKIKYLFQSSIRIVIPFSIFIGVLLFFLSDFFSAILNNENLSVFLKVFAVFIPLSAIGGTFHAVLRAYEKVKWYSFIGNILVPFSQLVFLIVLIGFNFKNNAIIFSYNLGMVALFVSAFLICKMKIPEIFEKPKINKNIKKELLKNLFSYSWPIIFLGLISSFFSYTDSFMIGYLKTVSDVGIYNAAVPIASLLAFMPALFLTFFLPVITREYSKKNLSLIKNISKQVNKWIFMFNLPMLAIVFIFPKEVISLFFGQDYIPAANALRLLSAGTFFYSLSIISDNLLSMVGKSRISLFNISVSSLVNIILNILLIPRFGIEGAAFSTLITYIVWTGLSFFWAKKYTSIVPLTKNMLRIFSFALLPTALILVFNQFIGGSILSMILEGIFFILLYALLIILNKGFDENDLMILKSIKNGLSKKLNFNSIKPL
jgi:O-antigen/teichoic acid export membrane protein